MPVAIPAIIGGAAVIGSAVMGSKASKHAADAQTNAANQANQTQRDMYNQTRSDLGGYRQTGNDAEAKLAQFYGVGGGPPVDYQKLLSGLPGYQFQMQSGTKAVDQNLAARGLLQSGAAGKELTKYGQGLGSAYASQYTAGLQGLVNTGENAAAQTGIAGANSANQQSSAYGYAGDAQAYGAMGQANAYGAGLQGLAGVAGQYYKPPPPRQNMDQLSYINPTAANYMDEYGTRHYTGLYQGPGA